MKQFLVSMALILFVCSCLMYQSKENRNLLLQTELKILAEECAEAGALSADDYCNINVGSAKPYERATECLNLECQALGISPIDFKLEELTKSVSLSSSYAVKITQISTGFSRSSVYEWVIK